MCHERCYTTLLNSVPLWTANKPIRNVDFVTLYFTTESARDVQAITKAHIEGEKPPFAHTNGLYGRELL